MPHDNGMEVAPSTHARSGRTSTGAFDVLFVNTNEKDGGAARAAHRIFSEIRRRALDVRYLTLVKESHDPDVSGRLRRSTLGRAVRALGRLDRIPLYFYRQRQPATFYPAFWPNPLRIRLAGFKAKLVHLHWVGAGLLRVDDRAGWKRA